MGAYEYALGPIAWILTDGLRQIGGRCAIALFGSSAELLTDGTQRLPLVPGIRTGGGTAFAGDAIVAASDCLEMTNPRRPRFAYVLSRRRLVRHARRRRADPLARRPRRPDHPHRDRLPRRCRSRPTGSSSSPTPPTRSTRSPPTPSPPCARPRGRRRRLSAHTRVPRGTERTRSCTSSRCCSPSTQRTPRRPKASRRPSCGEHTIHVGQARRLSPLAAATADFDLRVYVNRIELPPPPTAPRAGTTPLGVGTSARHVAAR